MGMAEVGIDVEGGARKHMSVKSGRSREQPFLWNLMFFRIARFILADIVD
jgi:hypothetical protein